MNTESAAPDSSAPIPKALVVDDEEPIQKILKSVLEREGFEVWTAANGKSAEEMIGLLDFTVVITDIKMPGSSGLELLKFIRRDHPNLPVVLMTGFAKILETQTAYELGAKAFLAKPFKRHELMGAIAEARKPEQPGSDSAMPAEPEIYCRVGIDQFLAGKSMNLEIFILLGDNQYAKIANQGEDLDPAKITALRQKQIEHLYVRAVEFSQYVGFNLALPKAGKPRPAVPEEKKLALLKNARFAMMKNLFAGGISDDSFRRAKDIIETSISLLAESPEAFDVLTALHASGDLSYAHALGVSLYGTLLAQQVGWNSPVTLFKVSTAGLLHDVGMKEADFAVLGAPRADLSPDHVERLEAHPARGVEILSKIPSLSPDILLVVLHHHEMVDGRGYPSKLRRHKINLTARLLSVADQFCELALTPLNAPRLSAQEAFERLCVSQSGTLDTLFVSALKSVLGLTEAT